MDKDKKLNPYSESLQEIINKYLSEGIYGEFVPVLSEIFQRRAAEYGYSDNEMEKQLKIFTRNVVSICFKPQEMMKGVAAHYCPPRGEIAFNRDFYNEQKQRAIDDPNYDFGEYFFEILTHEVYHAISHKKPNYIGLFKKGLFNVSDMVINEAFTETAASRTVFAATEDNLTRRDRIVTGYPSITFVPNLLAKVIGETEKNVLKAGMDGPDTLEELILSKYPKELHRDVKNGFNKFKFFLDEYYKRTENAKGRLSDRDVQIVEKSITEMENVALELFYHQVKNDPRACTAELAKEVNLREIRMFNCFGEISSNLEKRGLIPNIDFLNQKNSVSKRKRSIDVFRNIERIAFIRDEISDDGILDELDKAAKDGSLDVKAEEIQKKYGIDVTKLDKFRIKKLAETQKWYELPGQDTYKDRITKEDYHDFAEWDNSFVSIETTKVLDRQLKKFDIYKVLGFVITGAKTVKNGMNKVFKRIFKKSDENKLLPQGDSGQDTKSKSENTFDDEIRVDTSKINFKPDLSLDSKNNNVRNNIDKQNEGR